MYEAVQDADGFWDYMKEVVPFVLEDLWSEQEWEESGGLVEEAVKRWVGREIRKGGRYVMEWEAVVASGRKPVSVGGGDRWVGE